MMQGRMGRKVKEKLASARNTVNSLMLQVRKHHLWTQIQEGASWEKFFSDFVYFLNGLGSKVS